jgi:hypothetical protein
LAQALPEPLEALGIGHELLPDDLRRLHGLAIHLS